MTLVAYCPNCGMRYFWSDIVRNVQDHPGTHRCGDCAQAAVRPRSLYELRLVDPDRDSRPVDQLTNPETAV